MIPAHIVIHHSLTKDSQTVSWQAIRRYHLSLGYNGIGYHAGLELIGDRYEIMLGRMWNQSGAHTSQQGMNRISLGICCVGNFDDSAQAAEFVNLGGLEILCRLVASLQELFRISRTHIYRHSDFATYKSCPGLAFPWQAFLDGLDQ